MEFAVVLAWVFGASTLVYAGFVFRINREWGKTIELNTEILDDTRRIITNSSEIIEMNATLFEKVYGISLEDVLRKEKTKDA